MANRGTGVGIRRAMVLLVLLTLQGACGLVLVEFEMFPETLPNATVGSPYGQVQFSLVQVAVRTSQLNCSTTGATWDLNPLNSTQNFPPGMALSSLGVLSGTPTQAGTFQFEVRVRLQNQPAYCPTPLSKVYTLQVTAAPSISVTVAPTAASVAVNGTQAFTPTVQNDSANRGVTWSLSGASCSGAACGTLSSTAGSPVTYTAPAAVPAPNNTVTLLATSVADTSKTASAVITILAAPAALTITTNNFPDAMLGVAYSQTAQAAGGTTPYTWSVASGALPTGLFLDASSGALSGSPQQAGAFNFTLQVQDSAAPTPATATRPFTLTVNNPVPAITALNPAFAPVGAASTLLAVDGSGFVSGAQVSWNGTLRATTFISSSRVETTLAPSDLLAAATVPVQVENPAPGGGVSNALNFEVRNPAPAIASLSPNSANAGSPDITLTILGSDFLTSSVPLWNGVARTTGFVFVSSTEVRTTIPASDLVVAGTAQVSVSNPGPGGGTSSSLPFTIDPAAMVGVLERVSVSSAGVQANNSNGLASVSDDGNVVAFLSDATNLDGGQHGVYIHNVATGLTRLIVAGLFGLSNGARVSGDGASVFFVSSDNTLVAGDNNSAPDLFVIASCASGACPPGATYERVSLQDDESEFPQGASGNFSVSSDGQLVAFTSGQQVYVRNRQAQTTTLVSVDSNGNAASGNNPAISADGRYVAFLSQDQLDPGDPDNFVDVYLHDRVSGTTTRVSRGTQRQSMTPQPVDIFFPPAISEDGRYVAFLSNYSDLVPNDTNQQYDVFLFDRTSPSTTRVSVSPSGGQFNSPTTGFIAISGDGRLVAFASSDPLLQSGVVLQQIGVRDTCNAVAGGCTPTTFVVSQRPDGTLGNDLSQDVALSRNGQFAVFTSLANNFVSADTNNREDIFRARTGR